RAVVESAFVLGALAVVVALVALEARGTAVVPVLGLYAYAGFRIIPSTNRILMFTNEIRGGGAAVDTLHRDLTAMPDAPGQGGEPVEEPLPFADAIVLSRVSFTYEGAPRPALDDVDLVVRRGEMVGVVGATGTGKSTLVDVLIGLLPPTSGRVLVDGC